MNLEIVQRKPVRVAARRYVGPLGEPLGRFWRTNFSPWLAEHGLLDCPRFGISLDDPATTPPEQCRYECCVEAPAGMTLPDASDFTIGGGEYAVTHFKGTGTDIGAAWSAFLGACRLRGLRFDAARPAFEHYPRGSSYDPKTRVFACELCFPILPRVGS